MFHPDDEIILTFAKSEINALLVILTRIFVPTPGSITKLEPELLPKERLLDSLVTLLIVCSSKLCTGINKFDENTAIIAKVTSRDVAPFMCPHSILRGLTRCIHRSLYQRIWYCFSQCKKVKFSCMNGYF